MEELCTKNKLTNLKKCMTCDQNFPQIVLSVHCHMEHTKGHQIAVDMFHVDTLHSGLGHFQSSQVGKSLWNKIFDYKKAINGNELCFKLITQG